MLPPGDTRNCLVALSESGRKEQQLNDLFQYRFQCGSFEGMSLGNLIIAAMADMKGSFEKGIKAISELLNIRGKVLPPTTQDCHLCAELEDGSIRETEVNVRELDKPGIRHAFLKPEAPEALDEAVEEIHAADMIVMGPGSLFTSIVTNLLVPGIREALNETDAQKYFVCNVMTQPGQTDGFNASDHVKVIQKYLGDDALDAVVVNDRTPSPEIMERYNADGAYLVDLDDDLDELGVRVKRTDLLEQLDTKRVLWEKQDLLRHHPDKLGDALCRLYADMLGGTVSP